MSSGTGFLKPPFSFVAWCLIKENRLIVYQSSHHYTVSHYAYSNKNTEFQLFSPIYRGFLLSFFFFFVFSVLSDKVLEVKVNAIKETPGWPVPRCSLFFLPISTLVPALSVVPKQALPTPISEKKLFGTPLTFVTYNLVNKVSHVVFMVISVFNMCYS